MSNYEYEWVTDDMFDTALRAIVKNMAPVNILSIPGVYEAVSEHFNNDVLKELEAHRKQQ